MRPHPREVPWQDLRLVQCSSATVTAIGTMNPDPARAVRDQLIPGSRRRAGSSPAWLDCHVRMYEATGGVSAITVPDKLRSAIASAGRYEAQFNPAYRELSDH